AVTLENLKHVFRVPIDTFFDVPDRKLYAVKERDYRNATRKKKVLTAIDMLDDHELKFLSHVIKGFVKLRLLLSS
ncbi:MAG: hypothetical protein FWF80_06840, partial [Defluviitaleaceae bacterium]|nr:hypothetical protein [Defluviitaleaceae bacterium]